MSLGHWCFGLHCHMFTRFFGHWVETCHCAEFRFWTEEASNWSTWRLFEFSECFLLKQSLTRIAVHCRALLHDHCRALWQLWLPQLLEGLSSIQLSLTVVWLTSHWEGSTNWWLIHWECLHWATKVFQPLRCWHQHCQSLRLLRSTTYCWSLKLSLLWGLTVRHWRALHWAKTGFLQLPCLEVWLMDCMEFATQFLAQTVPATVFHWQHCTLADVRTGMHWRMRRHCFPTARCRTPPTHWRSSTAMASVDLRLWRSWLDWLWKVMWSPLARLRKVCALRPHWALPRRSWTLDWFLWNCSLIPALLRSLQIYWSGLTDTLDVQEHCSWTEEQLDWHWRKNWSVHWLQQTVLGPLLDYWITPTGCSVEHCGVPHWIWDPTALHCQGTDGATADGTELQQDLWFALQRTGWPLHPHCESAGTDAWRCEHWMCLAALVHWWGTAKENWKQTGNCSWRNWHCQGRCEDHWTACWIWGSDCDYHWSLRLSIPTWSLRQLFLNTAMLTDALTSWK